MFDRIEEPQHDWNHLGHDRTGRFDVSNSNLCKRCKQMLPSSDFYADKTKANGLRTNCKACMKAQDLERYLADPEKAKASGRKKVLNHYYRNHEQSKERNRLKERNARQANPEKVRAREARLRAKNRERIRANQRERQKNNPRKYKGLSYGDWPLERQVNLLNRGLIKRAKKYGCAIYSVTAIELIKLYSQPCVICNKSEAIQIDHIVPLKRKGSHSIGNLQPLCARHNASKGDRTMTEWRKSGLIDG